MNAFQWTDEEKASIVDAAKLIYATAVVEGAPCSKLHALREAVTTTLPPDRQQPIKSLAHVAYWVNAAWPVRTEPTDVIERVRADHAARAGQRTPLLLKVESPGVDTPVESASTESPSLEPGDLGDFWKPTPTKTEPLPTKESLFDEGQLAARAQQNALADVQVTHKRSRSLDLRESPEALIQRGLLGMLNERIDQVVDRRCAAIFGDKTREFISEALKESLSSFYNDMTILVSTLEESVNASIANLKQYVDQVAVRTAAPVDQPVTKIEVPETSERSFRQETNTSPVGAQTEDEAKKLAILIAGIHPTVADQIRRRFASRINLEIWTGPKHDKRSLHNLCSQPIDGMVVGDSNGGAEIFQALKSSSLPFIKVNGTVSGVGTVLERALQLHAFPSTNH